MLAKVGQRPRIEPKGVLPCDSLPHFEIATVAIAGIETAQTFVDRAFYDDCRALNGQIGEDMFQPVVDDASRFGLEMTTTYLLAFAGDKRVLRKCRSDLRVSLKTGGNRVVKDRLNPIVLMQHVDKVPARQVQAAIPVSRQANIGIELMNFDS